MSRIQFSMWQVRPLTHAVTSVLVMLSVLAVAETVQRPQPIPVSPPHLLDSRVPGGSLVIAGGGRVTPEIRLKFVELAGGPEAHIVVIPASDPEHGTEESWLDPWRQYPIASIEFCSAPNRKMATSETFCAALSHATGVWFSGGYQELLADRYVGTAVQTSLYEVLKKNGVVGGCSAGAAILSRVMIQEGENHPIEARGLGLIDDAVIDQHFLQRNRLWRMQLILEQHPQLVGLGVDEDTALVYEVRSRRLTIVGDSYALVCLPANGSQIARMEILHAGDDVLLDDLRKKHLAYQPSPQPETSLTAPLVQPSG